MTAIARRGRRPLIVASNARSTHQLVTLSDITCRYADGPAVLKDVSMSVTDGDFIGLVGPSGSGKTTLLRVLLNIVKPVAGIVTIRPGLRVGYVPQVETINWSFPVTVAEAVLMSARGTRLPWAKGDERQRVDTILHRLGIGAIADRHIRQLSGGQQQRVFIARALFSEPDLLLMDEPTSGVDVRTRHEILHLLGELNADGLAIVLSTHDLNGMAAHLPQLICLHTTVMGVGTPQEVLTPEILERTYGAPMDVLQHAGMPLVVDGRHHRPLGAVS